jgi:hypothetical protein
VVEQCKELTTQNYLFRAFSKPYKNMIAGFL